MRDPKFDLIQDLLGLLPELPPLRRLGELREIGAQRVRVVG
jgi:hypothetical protein